MIELIFDPALKAETWFDPTWFTAGWFDDELIETEIVPPVTAKEYGGKWFRSKKELALLEAQIQREDEELITLLTILIEKESLD